MTRPATVPTATNQGLSEPDDALHACLRRLLDAADAADDLGISTEVVRATQADAAARIGFPGDAYVLAFVGGTGVGKSSLLNALAGARIAATGEVGPTGKGRHTTTARELTVLPGQGLLLDTPGLRGVQLWEADGGLDVAFADLVELAERCRFRDCRHTGEPGCAIAAAVEDGTVSARRVASHAALRREVGWLRERYDARQRAEQRREWRQLSKAVRAGRRSRPRPPR